MTSSGAQTSQPRRAILTFSRDDGDYVVAGTAGGSPTTPAWVANVRENPEVQVEAENRTFTARAMIVDGDERDRLWDQHVKRLPWFAYYPAQTGRVIPMVRLSPADS
jgi:deazaflavin-dependent oxidoreductase (nitroreductase family)